MAIITDFENAAFLNPSEQELITEELIDLIPSSWTKGEAKRPGGILHLVLSSIGLLLSIIKNSINLLKKQIRIKTATGSHLDTISLDYFGEGIFTLPRLMGESDDNFRMRILAEILREKATLNGVIKAVEMLTGTTPSIFEPFNALGTAVWMDVFNPQNAPNAYVSSDYVPNTIGAWGDNSVHAFQNPDGTTGDYTINGAVAPNSANAAPNVGNGAGGDIGQIYTFYVYVNSPIKHSIIQALVDRIKPVGTIGIVYGGANG